MRKSQQIYDDIGRVYAKHRKADSRLVKYIVEALNLPSGKTILDLGAGTGTYSRALADLGHRVKAVEPSEIMIQQAINHTYVQYIAGRAEEIPLRDDSVDGVVTVLASHHFSSLSQAAAEMKRICKTGPLIWFTLDPRAVARPWFADYFPDIWGGTFRYFPPLERLTHLLEQDGTRVVSISSFLVPHDLEDGFLAAGWRRPEMFLDPLVRRCMSGFALADPAGVAEGLHRLESDLKSGRWQRKNQSLLTKDVIDWGYRTLCASIRP